MCTADGINYRFKIRETNEETFLHGIDWDCYGCDYGIRQEDTLTFTIEQRGKPVLLKATGNDGSLRFMPGVQLRTTCFTCA